MPLTVRREIVEHQRLAGFLAEAQVGEILRRRLGFERRQVLAELNVAGMIQVEVLPSREGAPWDHLLHVVGVR